MQVTSAILKQINKVANSLHLTLLSSCGIVNHNPKKKKKKTELAESKTTSLSSIMIQEQNFKHYLSLLHQFVYHNLISSHFSV